MLNTSELSNLNDVNPSIKNLAKNQYEQDFYAWTQEQAQLLRIGKL